MLIVLFVVLFAEKKKQQLNDNQLSHTVDKMLTWF